MSISGFSAFQCLMRQTLQIIKTILGGGGRHDAAARREGEVMNARLVFDSDWKCFIQGGLKRFKGYS